MTKSSKKVQGVIFDLGHTLMEFKNEWEDVYRRGHESLSTFLQKKGYPVDEAVVRDFFKHFFEQHHVSDTTMVEYTATQAIQSTFKKHSLNHADEAFFQEALEAFFLPEVESWHAKEGSLDLLKTLKKEGYRVGLISNASHHPFVMQCVEKMGFSPYLDPIISSAGFPVRKPHPDIFFHVAEMWGMKPEEIAVVGDQLYFDVFGAHQAGMSGIWINLPTDKAHTFIPPDLVNDPLLQPEGTIVHLAELPDLLRKIE